jgi:tRNA threonylcarbamoyladenosine biosynthesis protein TsaE
MDLYRLHGAEEITAAGLEEYLGCDGVTLVEWADRCLELLPGWTLSADFTITSENTRRIVISGRGERQRDIIRRMKRILAEAE